GNIEVIGKGEPQIYINGRRMLDRSELLRLSSKDIQSIDALSNPGARYGADVKAVILIKTVRKQGDGLSGSLQALFRQAHSLSQSDNLALNYRTAGIDIFGSLNYDHTRLYQQQRNTMHIRTAKDLYLLNSKILILPSYSMITGNIGINWQINPKHSVGMKYECSGAPYSKSYWYTDEDIYLNRLPTEKIFIDTHWSGHSLPDHSVNLYYLGKIKSFSINITNDYFSQYKRNSQDIAETSDLTGVKIFGSRNRVINKLWASKGIATYTYGKNELEFGYEFTLTDRKDFFENINNELTDADNRIKESNISGFMAVYIPIGKVEFNAGLRYERVKSDYYMHSCFIPGQSRQYSRFYPNFDFSFPLKKANFTLSYTSKTKRPSYSLLSSAIQYDDRFTYESGNPLLTSEMIHDISLAGLWKWVFFSIGWQYDKDAIISVIKPFEEGSPVNLMSYVNIPNLSKYNLVLSLSPKIRRWSPRFRLNLLGQDFELHTREGIKKMNNPVLFWSQYNTFNLGKGFNLTADLTGWTRGDMDVVTLKPSWQLNIGLTKNVRGWFFQLQASDIFKTARNSMTTFGEQMRLEKWNYSDSQALRLIIRYSFNATSSRYKGKTAGISERSRL
ncbi:MAG: outer membrane beta-barrel family protein, partial [Muribaculaceae bacterium]|nr:outer membrane beta-barrel family protein [Muribaculaceae bacterium]